VTTSAVNTVAKDICNGSSTISASNDENESCGVGGSKHQNIPNDTSILSDTETEVESGTPYQPASSALNTSTNGIGSVSCTGAVGPAFSTAGSSATPQQSTRTA